MGITFWNQPCRPSRSSWTMVKAPSFLGPPVALKRNVGRISSRGDFVIQPEGSGVSAGAAGVAGGAGLLEFCAEPVTPRTAAPRITSIQVRNGELMSDSKTTEEEGMLVVSHAETPASI